VTDAAPGEPRSFLPSWPVYHRHLLGRLVWAVPLMLLCFLIAAPSVALGVIGLGSAVLGGGIALALYFGRTRVTVTGEQLRIRGPLRTRSWPRAAIATLVLLPLPGTRRATLYGVSPALSRMFSLSAATWEDADLDQIAEAIGAPIVKAPVGLAVVDIKERYPGTIGWAITHPWAVMLLVGGGAVLLTLALAVVSAVVLIGTGQVPMPVPSPTGS
jgi:hypothetical protein